MNKTTASYLLLLNMVLLVLVGCNFSPSTTQLSTTTPLPLYSPTGTPPFSHYTSVSKSNIYLEFDYPSSWGLGDDLLTNEIRIALYDPRFFTLPTPSPNENHPILNDFGVIDIWIHPLTPDLSFEEYVQARIDKKVGYITFLDNYKTQIAGFDTVVLEYRIEENNPEIHTSKMFVRDMFFSTKDLIYKIGFTIAEKDRGNEFEQGYEYFIDSLNVIP